MSHKDAIVDGTARKRGLIPLASERIQGLLHPPTLFQGFLSPSLALAGALQQLPTDLPDKPSLSHVLRLMHRVMERGRAVLKGHRSPKTASSNLEPAFSDLVAERAASGKATFRILVMGLPKADPTIQEQVYLIGREAFFNALRHSNATSIEVGVGYLPRELRVVVRDSGCTIGPQVLRSEPDSHGGLLKMHERTRAMGAQLCIGTRKGAGTEVEVCLRLKAMSDQG